jgi:hypothetical protein
MQDFILQLPTFVKHHYVKRWQAAYYNSLRLSSTSSHLLLQIDFAENFTCQQQDEVQAAHWLQSQVSIFTACCWHGESSPSSFVVISDNLQHDKTTVASNLIQVLQKILPVHQQCKVLDFFPMVLLVK